MKLLQVLVLLPFVGALIAYLVPKLKTKIQIFIGVGIIHLILSAVVITSGDRYGEVQSGLSGGDDTRSLHASPRRFLGRRGSHHSGHSSPDL